MIFVQIAAYREMELLATINDCINKAKHPQDLNFGICWQTDVEDACIDEFIGRHNFRIDRVMWYESKGLGWARSRIQAMYEGEEFTLQIDAHHRFAENWDEKLIHFLELTGAPRPIITSYAGMYEPVSGEKSDGGPYKMVAQGFSESGTIPFRPHLIAEWRDISAPIRARFVSGHFFFTLGCHCSDYKYDPNLYFAGDEISLSIRSYTLGYDLFHPHRTVLWHEYTRKGRVKHWDDHNSQNKSLTERLWHERDEVSKRRLRKMLQEEDNDEDLGCYGLGTNRSHRDYEMYAGIDFRRRLLHVDTLAGKDPPTCSVDSEVVGAGFASKRSVTLRWKASDLKLPQDVDFVYFGVEDELGNVVYRFDASSDSAEARGQVNIKTVSFYSTLPARALIIWPVSRSQGWLTRTTYAL